MLHLISKIMHYIRYVNSGKDCRDAQKICYALHDVPLAARMSRAFLNKIKQYGLLLEMGERWNYDNCYYDVQIIVCNVDWFLPV